MFIIVLLYFFSESSYLSFFLFLFISLSLYFFLSFSIKLVFSFILYSLFLSLSLFSLTPTHSSIALSSHSLFYCSISLFYSSLYLSHAFRLPPPLPSFMLIPLFLLYMFLFSSLTLSSTINCTCKRVF